MSRRTIERRALSTLLGRTSWQQKAIALCLLALVACSAYWVKPDTNAAPGSVLHGKVIAVADGDTVTVLDAGRQTHKIRLAFIDAPEKNQAYGQRAKQSLSDKVYQREVQVEISEKDQYGRDIGLIRQDGQDINLSMLVDGYAWHYRYYAKKSQTSDEFRQYEAAQQHAQQEKRGLWQDKQPQPPWEFRQQSKRN